MEPVKSVKPYLSKTILVNAFVSLVGLVAMFLPSAAPLKEWAAANVEMILTVLGVLGMGLRLITKGKIELGS